MPRVNHFMERAPFSEEKNACFPLSRHLDHHLFFFIKKSFLPKNKIN